MEVTWEFSTPASTHNQGFIERKIRTFRDVTEEVLKTDNNKRIPTDFELLIILRETEYVMNFLPLGRHSGNEDSLQSLRRIDRIVEFCAPGNKGASLYQSVSRNEFRKRYVYTQKIADIWWNRWLSTYLPSLQRRQKWTTVENNIKKGDAVLFVHQTNPLRAVDPFSVVADTKLGKDGGVRSATIRTTDRLIRERSIRKLVLLERSTTPEDRNSIPQSDVSDDSEPIAVFAGNRSDDVSKPQYDVCDDSEQIVEFAGKHSDDVYKTSIHSFDGETKEKHLSL